MEMLLKNYILFSIYFFSIINKIESLISISNISNQIYYYPDDKIKMKNVCAISGIQNITRGDITNTYYFLYLKKKCGKKEKCVETQSGYYQCVKKTFLQKIGDKCGVNEECYTGLCYSGECSAIQNDEDCTSENDPSNPEKVCSPGHWCFEYDSLSHYFKCVPYLNEDEEYNNMTGKVCRFGLAPLKNEYGKVVCQKYGTIEDGKESNNYSELCQSGFSGKDIDDGIQRCFSVVTDSDCLFNSSSGDYYCQPIVNGLHSKEVYKINESCTSIYNDSHYICPYTIGKMNAFKEFITKLNEINFDDVYKDEKKFHSFGYGNNDFSKAYQKYYYFDYLYSLGMINKDGEIIKKKEWEFFWKMNKSDYNRISFIQAIMFFLLLCIY